MSIDTVVFDVGNVLLRWHPRNLYVRTLGLSPERMERLFAETGLHEMNLDFDRGRPFEEGIAELVARHPDWSAEITAFHTRWLDLFDGAIESNVALMRELKSRGVPVYGLTNYARSQFDLSIPVFPFLAEFDGVVVSGDHGVIKPDPRIYRLLNELYGIDLARAVFIDDIVANVEAARAHGMGAIHFVSEDVDVRAELRKLGFPV